MFKFINLKYGKNNLYRRGFEESQKRIDDLRTLVKEYKAPVTFKEIVNIEHNSDNTPKEKAISVADGISQPFKVSIFP